MTGEGTSTRIRSLKANVTREEAIRHFTNGVLNGAVELIRGPVRSLAEFYIPYRLFEVRIRSGGREQTQTFAMDAVRGVLDLYQLPSVAADDQLLTLQTRNVLPAELNAAQAEERLIAKVRRMVFTQGFFRVRDLKIEATPVSGEICVPYWVCFRGSGDRAHLAILDAVRRRPEGAKVRRLVEEWLRSDSAGAAAS
ncbi:MAG: hypothetical protein DMG80_21235 [Acidobacteria bacterium]|nr:MAG: hypothetical protein DMG80_21235 [Acidobacteriota bacterium]